MRYSIPNITLALVTCTLTASSLHAQSIPKHTATSPLDSQLAKLKAEDTLTDAQLDQASAMREGLQKARELYASGVTSTDRILSKFRLHLDKRAPLSKIDYLECVCADSLHALSEVDKPAVIATAVFFGQVRLIDNIVL